MKLSRFSMLAAVCCFMIIGTLVVGCSEDNNPFASGEYGWDSLGTGTNNVVRALTVFDNKLIAWKKFRDLFYKELFGKVDKRDTFTYKLFNTDIKKTVRKDF